MFLTGLWKRKLLTNIKGKLCCDLDLESKRISLWGEVAEMLIAHTELLTLGCQIQSCWFKYQERKGHGRKVSHDRSSSPKLLQGRGYLWWVQSGKREKISLITWQCSVLLHFPFYNSSKSHVTFQCRGVQPSITSLCVNAFCKNGMNGLSPCQ